MKKLWSDHSQRRTLLGVTIIFALIIDAVIVGVLIGVKGIVLALPAIAGGIVFVVLSAVYWLRSENDDANTAGPSSSTAPNSESQIR
jgi:hypothetical protein